MDYKFHDIKMFVCTASAPHTVHKTMRAPCVKRGQALHRGKSPPLKCPVLCGLLDVSLMTVGFVDYHNVGCLFSFTENIPGHLSTWQCYAAKYP